jgi:flagellum-specific ATP synthase
VTGLLVGGTSGPLETNPEIPGSVPETLGDVVRLRMSAAATVAAPKVEGRVAEVVGLGVGVRGLRAAVGELVTVHTNTQVLPAQVVSVHMDGVTCMPLGATQGVAAGDAVTPSGDVLLVPAGYEMLGRIVDALGRPLDGFPEPHGAHLVGVDASAPNPLHRRRVDTVLPTGVRALDTLVPVGAGQRVGIMAGSGVGKSTLLGMAVKGTIAPVRVVALVGERGR